MARNNKLETLIKALQEMNEIENIVDVTLDKLMEIDNNDLNVEKWMKAYNIVKEIANLD